MATEPKAKQEEGKEEKKTKPGHHPNSLANLAPVFNSETAKEAQRKSVIARKANREARERLKITAKELKMDIDELMSAHNVTALDVLRLSMIKSMDAGDFDTAVDIAKSIAEFETPKLGRVEQTNVEITADDMSDEELERRLSELMPKKKED